MRERRTRDSRRGGSGGVPISALTQAQAEALISARVFSWIRPLSGQSTASFVDKVNAGVGARAIDPSHNFTAGIAVSAVGTSANLNGQDSAPFTGTERYDSSLAPANWNFLVDGTGCTLYFVYAQSSATAGTKYMLSTQVVSTPRLELNRSTSDLLLTVYNAGAQPAIGAFATTGTSVNTCTYTKVVHGTANTPNYATYKNHALAASGAYSFTPGGALAQTLRLGAASGANGADFLFADLIIDNKNVPSTQGIVERYLSLRYAL